MRQKNGRRRRTKWETLLGAATLVLQMGCPYYEVCDNALHDALLEIRAQWPNYGAAKASSSPFWIEAHSFGELEGVGLTLVAMEEAPSWENPFPSIRESNGELLKPSLLFFDVRERDDCWFTVDDEAPLIILDSQHFEKVSTKHRLFQQPFRHFFGPGSSPRARGGAGLTVHVNNTVSRLGAE